jgi:hypothetical protein
MTSLHTSSGVVTQPASNVTTPCVYRDYGNCMTEEEYISAIEAYAFPRLWEWVLVALYLVVFIVGLVGNWYALQLHSHFYSTYTLNATEH